MSRLFTAKRAGAVVRRGTFVDEKLLRRDMPGPEYELVLDEHLPFPERSVGYQEQRRGAYPPIADFADAMYWQTQGDDSKLLEYMAKCAAVKEQFPKIDIK
ncbi:MAG: hypothetical protein V4631_20905 [Pseudomonadota bacterium]